MSFSSQNLRELNPWADPWWSHIVRAAADEIERLRAENARLREALQNILDVYGDDLPGKMARAALAGRVTDDAAT